MSWVVALLLLLTPAVVAAQPSVKINDLIERAREYDRQTVTVEGEAIGDIMIRGQFGWVNVSDGTNDVGVWAPTEELRRIRFAGRYHTRGDWVQVTGTFYRADLQHGGDLDIQATELKVLKEGGEVERPVPAGHLPLALGTLAAAALAWLRARSRVATSGSTQL